MIVEIEKTPEFTITNIFPDHTTQEEWNDLGEKIDRFLKMVEQRKEQEAKETV